MNKKRNLLFIAIVVSICLILGLKESPDSRPAMTGLRIACNDDAAGLLIKYLAKEDGAGLEVVDMSYQQLQDCCNSQTELALSGNNFDMAVLCPDSAQRLIDKGQPFAVIGDVVFNANVLVTNQDIIPHTVGYMNLREIQKDLVWANLNSGIEMQPMLPAGLPYALQRSAVEGIVLDILGVLKIDGFRRALPSAYPTAVLAVHKDLLGTPELASFIKVYNQAVTKMNSSEILMQELAKYLDAEDSFDEVKVWKDMGIKFQTIEIKA